MQEDRETIADEVRGGRNRPEDIERGIGLHPSGVAGISVHAADVPVIELANGIPHGQVGITTVADVRTAGGDVIRTSGRNHYHATLTGLSPVEISNLLTPTQPNPARSKRKVEDAGCHGWLVQSCDDSYAASLPSTLITIPALALPDKPGCGALDETQMALSIRKPYHQSLNFNELNRRLCRFLETTRP